MISGTKNLVAFTAGIRKGKSVFTDGTVIFDDLKANVGWHYTPSTGKFTCPVTAHYAFYTTLHRDHTREYDLKADVVKNGSPIIQAISALHEEESPPVQTSSSNMAVILCEEGDEVWVRAKDYDQTVYAYQAPLSTFSGVMLSKGVV